MELMGDDVNDMRAINAGSSRYRDNGHEKEVKSQNQMNNDHAHVDVHQESNPSGELDEPIFSESQNNTTVTKSELSGQSPDQGSHSKLRGTQKKRGPRKSLLEKPAVSCAACRLAHKQCSGRLENIFPCQRCLRLGMESECKPGVRKRPQKRKKKTGDDSGTSGTELSEANKEKKKEEEEENPKQTMNVVEGQHHPSREHHYHRYHHHHHHSPQTPSQSLPAIFSPLPTSITSQQGYNMSHHSYTPPPGSHVKPVHYPYHQFLHHNYQFRPSPAAPPHYALPSIPMHYQQLQLQQQQPQQLQLQQQQPHQLQPQQQQQQQHYETSFIPLADISGTVSSAYPLQPSQQRQYFQHHVSPSPDQFLIQQLQQPQQHYQQRISPQSVQLSVVPGTLSQHLFHYSQQSISVHGTESLPSNSSGDFHSNPLPHNLATVSQPPPSSPPPPPPQTPPPPPLLQEQDPSTTTT